MKKLLFLSFVFVTIVSSAQTTKEKISVIGYYAGDAQHVDAYSIEKLTHIIFSFCHLKGNKLNVDNKNDSVTIKHLVELKKRNPSLKVILSIGDGAAANLAQWYFQQKKVAMNLQHPQNS